MKTKTCVICTVTVFVLCAGPKVSVAQRAGFQIGIAQPSPAFAPTQAPAIATRSTFIANPLSTTSSTIVVIQNEVVAPNPVFIPNQFFVPNPVFTPNQVFIPENPIFIVNQVFAPNPVLIPNQFVVASPVFGPNSIPTQIVSPNQILAPGQTIISTPTVQPFVTPTRARFGPPSGRKEMNAVAPGMSRAEVLRQFGRPAVTVATRTGEMLYFDNGITITLQNGQVSGPR